VIERKKATKGENEEKQDANFLFITVFVRGKGTLKNKKKTR
jgi:hypothetical protein